MLQPALSVWLMWQICIRMGTKLAVNLDRSSSDINVYLHIDSYDEIMSGTTPPSPDSSSLWSTELCSVLVRQKRHDFYLFWFYHTARHLGWQRGTEKRDKNQDSLLGCWVYLVGVQSSLKTRVFVPQASKSQRFGAKVQSKITEKK